MTKPKVKPNLPELEYKDNFFEVEQSINFQTTLMIRSDFLPDGTVSTTAALRRMVGIQPVISRHSIRGIENMNGALASCERVTNLLAAGHDFERALFFEKPR